MRIQRIPLATIARLPVYVQGLKSLAETGTRLISSQRLAAATGVEAPQIRRDLSHLGAFGTPGVGYDVNGLLHEISHCLGLSRTWRVALAGYGRLGSALAAYPGFLERNFRIAAIFDNNPALVGMRVGHLEVMHSARIPSMVKELDIEIGIVATTGSSAQEVADQFVASGVTSLLNFAPVTLTLPDRVVVRNIDLAAEMQILSFHETMRHAPPVPYMVKPAVQHHVSRWLRE